MTSTITRIEKTYTHTAHWPVAFGRLDCGHSCEVTKEKWTAAAHDESTYYRHIGDTVECKECTIVEKKLQKIREAVEAGHVHHTRARYRMIYAYALDPKSPSGFMLVASVQDCPASKQYFDSLIGTGLSPLSPTEPA